MKIDCEKEAVEQMAKEILAAARTAPKGKGADSLITALTDAEDRKRLAAEMRKQAAERGAFFERDAGNIENSDAVVFLGLKDSKPLGLNCGGCGFPTCAAFSEKEKETRTFAGPICAIKLLDLGIALGAAASKAKDMCLDTRIMYSAGAAACVSGMIDAEIAIALPMSVSGKNIYFDRKA